MRVIQCLILFGSSISAVSAQSGQQNQVLTDLSGGYRSSWTFGSSIANDRLWANGLDGGLLPGDGNSTHNYLMSVSLKTAFELSDNSNYKLALVPSDVPILKDQAFWSNQANSSLVAYGGRGAGNTSQNNGAWVYNIPSASWNLESSGAFIPRRFEEGAFANAPAIQAAFWLGGYESRDTNPSVTGSTQNFAPSSSGMLGVNTTTFEVAQINTPFAPVQFGALTYLPFGERGVLVFFGGESPTATSGDNLSANAAPNGWDHVWVFDVQSEAWYKQVTKGRPPPRTQFCTTAAFDNATASWQIYVIGGANYNSQQLIPEIWLLSIPSFTWYRAGSLKNNTIMSLSCQMYGSQIFLLGGRDVWDDVSGDMGQAAFIYDAVKQTQVSSFFPRSTDYTAPSSVVQDIKTAAYPTSWTDPSMAAIFNPSASSADPTSTSSADSGTKSSSNISGGAIAGIVVAIVVVLIITAAIVYFLRRRRSRRAVPVEESKTTTTEVERQTPEVSGRPLHEMDGFSRPGELPVPAERYELMGDYQGQELGTKEEVSRVREV